METLLEGRQLSKAFGGVQALRRVDFNLRRGEILGLIGPNGAGKTTLINLISGALRPSSGELTFKARPIHGLPAHRIAQLGIARGFQISRAFLGMTVEENILVGALFGIAGADDRRDRKQEVEAILELVGLEARRADRVQALNVPDRKKVDLGRALAMRPEVLMLDELMAGLNTADMQALIALLRQITHQGISLIVIEHVMKVIVDVCQRVVVLHHGQKIAEGPPLAVMHDPLVVEAYLGQRYRPGAAVAAPARP